MEVGGQVITGKKESARTPEAALGHSERTCTGRTVNGLLGQPETCSLEGDFFCVLPINKDMKCEGLLIIKFLQINYIKKGLSHNHNYSALQPTPQSQWLD